MYSCIMAYHAHLLTITGHILMSIVERLHQAHQMRSRSQQYQDVENLVRAPHHIESSGLETFRNASLGYAVSIKVAILREVLSYGVKQSPSDVENTLGDHPRETHLAMKLLVTEKLNAVKHRPHGREAHCDEHGSPVWPPLGGTELGIHGEHCAGYASCGHLE